MHLPPQSYVNRGLHVEEQTGLLLHPSTTLSLYPLTATFTHLVSSEFGVLFVSSIAVQGQDGQGPSVP